MMTSHDRTLATLVEVTLHSIMKEEVVQGHERREGSLWDGVITEHLNVLNGYHVDSQS